MRIHTLALLGCLAAGPLAAQPAGDEAGVLAVVRGFHAALTSGDGAKAMALVADDVVFLEAGSVETRAQYREGSFARRHRVREGRVHQAQPYPCGHRRRGGVGDKHQRGYGHVSRQRRQFSRDGVDGPESWVRRLANPGDPLVLTRPQACAVSRAHRAPYVMIRRT